MKVYKKIKPLPSLFPTETWTPAKKKRIMTPLWAAAVRCTRSIIQAQMVYVNLCQNHYLQYLTECFIAVALGNALESMFASMAQNRLRRNPHHNIYDPVQPVIMKAFRELRSNR